MKCYVVLDKKGQLITAGFAAAPEPEALLRAENEFQPELRAGPEAEDGQTMIKFDVPDEHARMPVADLVARLQVEAQARVTRSD